MKTHESALRLAKVLYRNDEIALQDFKDASSDWYAFYSGKGNEIGFDLPYLQKIWKDGPNLYEVALVILDKAMDSFPFDLVREDDLSELRETMVVLEDAKLVVVREEEFK